MVGVPVGRSMDGVVGVEGDTVTGDAAVDEQTSVAAVELFEVVSSRYLRLPRSNARNLSQRARIGANLSRNPLTDKTALGPGYIFVIVRARRGRVRSG